MSFFGLGDIVFDKINELEKSPLQALFNSNFELTTLRYPVDLGNFDKSHYVIFYIKKQKNSTSAVDSSQYNIDSSIINALQNPAKLEGELYSQIKTSLSGISEKLTSTVGSIVNGVGKSIEDGINNMLSTASSILSGDSGKTEQIITNSIKNITGGSLGLLQTNLTTDAIALYMPDTLMYNHTQHYDDISLGNTFSGQILGAVRSAIDAHKTYGEEGASYSASKSLLMNAVDMGMSSLGDTGRYLSAAFLGSVKNPMLEMLYVSPSLRTFNFEFMFYPRSRQEALNVQKIIERFRYHQAPELTQFAQGFLVPPSEFEIKMYYNGTENPNLPQIATCVLENVTIDYAPGGFAAYEMQNDNTASLGGTGMPVAIRMNLQFKETTYLTKNDFNEQTALSNGGFE